MSFTLIPTPRLSTYQAEQALLDSTEVTRADLTHHLRDVICVGAVAGCDGVCVVQADGRVLLASPPLATRQEPPPTRFSFAFAPPPRGSAGPGGRNEGIVSAAREELSALLLSLARGEVGLTSEGVRDGAAAARLRACLSLLTAVEVGEVALVVSEKIVQRSTAGHHWGREGGDRGVGDRGGDRGVGRAQYQLAHRLISDKTDAHERLIDALRVTGLLFSCDQPALTAAQQQLAACLGLCGSLQEGLQRVSADASSDTHNARFLHAACTEGLAVLSRALELAVSVRSLQVGICPHHAS